MMNCFKNFNAIQINNTSDIVKKADNNAKIDKIENKISDHDIYIYIYIYYYFAVIIWGTLNFE